MQSAFLVPMAGLVIPNPRTRRPLAAAGELVELDAYWSRRLDEGAVVVQDSAPPEEARPIVLAMQPAASDARADSPASTPPKTRPRR